MKIVIIITLFFMTTFASTIRTNTDSKINTNTLKFWCRGKFEDVSNSSLIVVIDKLNNKLELYSDNLILIDDDLQENEVTYSAQSREYIFKIDRRSLQYTLITPSYTINGNCVEDRGPKI